VIENVTSEKLLNGGFESGAASWSGTAGAIGNWNVSPYFQKSFTGLNAAYLGGNGKTATESLYQTATIPASATKATLSFYLHIDSAESTSSTASDKLAVSLQNAFGTVLKTLATYSNLNKVTGYQLRSFDVSAFKGQTIRVYFKATEDSMYQTSFLLDNVSLQVQLRGVVRGEPQGVTWGFPFLPSALRCSPKGRQGLQDRWPDHATSRERASAPRGPVQG